MRKERSHASDALKYRCTKRPIVHGTRVLGIAWRKQLRRLQIFDKMPTITIKKRVLRWKSVQKIY